jgi:hypothetical protein
LAAVLGFGYRWRWTLRLLLLSVRGVHEFLQSRIFFYGCLVVLSKKKDPRCFVLLLVAVTIFDCVELPVHRHCCGDRHDCATKTKFFGFI